MRPAALLVCLAVSFAGSMLAGCSGGTGAGACSTLASSGPSLQSKLGTCDAGAQYTFLSICPQATCSEAFALCSPADQAVIVSHANCIANAPACVPGATDRTWLPGLQACEIDGGAIGNACAAAFNDAGCFLP